MAVYPKFLGGATLGAEADIYTVPLGKICRLEHLIISNGATAGKVTVKFFDNSGNISYELINERSIEANGVLELASINLEAGDKIKASATTTTGAKITLFGAEGDA